MTTKEKLDRLLAIIGELTEFYGELSGELPPLRFVGAGASANSELKKCAGEDFAIPLCCEGGRPTKQ